MVWHGMVRHGIEKKENEEEDRMLRVPSRRLHDVRITGVRRRPRPRAGVRVGARVSKCMLRGDAALRGVE